ncbi:hypothetical protein [Aquimarina algicola]|uniref:Replication protein n=1 Tax=Aquimarina algicola TaxID=2589995 RepID=A0A504JG23_9FLAO|nr:hypothetical protein [Aquimarina algicola]TPN87415.1 hypothetical protein FHK87_07485 [Aquimarina algicola]
MNTNDTAPLRPHYDFGSIFKATKVFIDRYNEQHDRLTERLNANHRATAELITRLYAQQLNKAISLGEDVSTSLPGFKTFNPSLASCKGCTVRTIINHKERLKASGFIIEEVHRGKTGIELWINPQIFAPKKISTPHVDMQPVLEQIQAVSEHKVKNLPPLVHEQQEQKNNNSSVDTLITSKKGVRLSAHRTKNNSVTGTGHEQDMNTRESRTSDSKKQTRGAKKSSQKESESAFLLQLVRDFWSYAKLVLFAELLLSEPEETEILNHIWASVYRKFKIKGSKEDWKGYQDILYKRVDMVARYLERNPNRWIAPPHLYFYPENKRNGFNKTYEWFIRQELLKKSIRNQILIQNTEKEWEDHNQGKGRHKHKSRLQLFRIQQQRLSTFKDDALLRAYEKSLQRTLLKPTTK